MVTLMYYKTTTLKKHINDTELSDKFWDVMKATNTIHYKWSLSGVRSIGGYFYDKDRFEEEVIYIQILMKLILHIK